MTALSSWLLYRHQPVAYAWVREVGGFGPHTHVLLHLAPELRGDLHQHLLRAGRFNPIHDGTKAILITPGARPCMTSPVQVGGLLRYFGKHLAPVARHDGDLVMPTLGIDGRGRGPCTIQGKRSGVSRNLGRKARAAAGWSELTTLAELRSVLDGEGVCDVA